MNSTIGYFTKISSLQGTPEAPAVRFLFSMHHHYCWLAPLALMIITSIIIKIIAAIVIAVPSPSGCVQRTEEVWRKSCMQIPVCFRSFLPWPHKHTHRARQCCIVNGCWLLAWHGGCCGHRQPTRFQKRSRNSALTLHDMH